MLYMSSPSAPDASCLRLPSSSAWRFSPLAATSAASLRPTTTTPSSSAITASPGITLTPARTTGTFTEPSAAFTVPLAEIARDHTGKPISRAGIDDEALDAARHQRCRQEIAEHAVSVVGRTADHQKVAGLALLDRDMDHPIVAGMRQHGHRRARGLAAGPHRTQIRLHQAAAAMGLVHGGDPERA